MEAAPMLRQFIGEIHQQWYFLDHDNCSMVDNYFGSIVGQKRGSPTMVEAPKPPLAKKSRKEKPRDKILGASCSAEIMMDQHIWKEFPEDILELVITRLPVATFFRFRSVCHKWNSLLTSATLPHRFAEVLQEQPPWFYAITAENTNCGAMYDPTVKKWFRPSIPFLPSKTIIHPVASAGGLVCLLDIRDNTWSVCNPLTSSFRELRPASSHVWPHVSAGMVQYGSPGETCYKIMWLQSNGDHEVYDSVNNSWTRPGMMPPSIKLPLRLNLGSHTVSIGNTIYFVRTNPDGIVSYDVVTGAWKQLIVPFPPHLRYWTLAEDGGQLLLVGLLSKNAATCIGVWELQKMTLLWKEVDRMPNMWCLEFYGKRTWMSCIGNRGLLMLSLTSKQLQRLVSYDVAKRQWGKVSDCILPRSGRKRHLIACGTAFYPCPTDLA